MTITPRASVTGMTHRPLAMALLISTLALTNLAAKITYTISFNERTEHYINIDLDIDGLRQKTFIELKMAVWTPGSYLVREFARNVQDLVVTSGRSALPVAKIDKHTWRVELNGERRITVSYKVYAYEVSVRTSYVDGDMAMLNGASIFIYPVGLEAQENLVVINLPRGWQQATSSMTHVGGRSPVFRAANFDQLVDSPIMLGRHQVIEFEVGGIGHRYAISGEGNFNQGQLVADTRLIIEAIHDIYGSVPYADYTIFLQLRDRARGGLEHLNSTHLIYPRRNFDTENYQRYLSLLAHELFHTYNVKRIRPQPLGPFNYGEENYTTLLWVAEGHTVFYSRALLRRTNLISPEKFIDMLGEDIRDLEARPGRLHQSLQEASFDAWIKYYRRNENSPNSTISYYDKGHLVGVILDLAIRASTSGQKNMDDVFKILWQGFNDTGNGYTEEEFRAICESVAGHPLDAEYRYITTTDEIDWTPIFEPFGLRVERSHADPADSAAAWFGLQTGNGSGSPVIDYIASGSPAAAGGLSVNDELLAVDNFRLTSRSLEDLLKTRPLTSSATFLVNRDGIIRSLKVRPTTPPFDTVSLIQVENPTAGQKQLYEQWLHTTWD